METSTWFKLAGSRKLSVCGQGVQAPWLFHIPGFSAFQVGPVNGVAVTVGQSRQLFRSIRSIPGRSLVVAQGLVDLSEDGDPGPVRRLSKVSGCHDVQRPLFRGRQIHIDPDGLSLVGHFDSP